MAAVATKLDTREVILDATDRLMARFGFRKMTMDDLAKEAKVSKRTIYLYFQSKEDVGLSSIGRVVEGVHQRLQDVAESDLPALQKIHDMLMDRVLGRIEAVRDYYHGLDELFEVVRPAYMARRKMYFEKELELIASVLESGCRAGEIECYDIPATANALLLATNAFLPYSLSARELGQPEEVKHRLEAMLQLLMRGLRPQHDHQENP
ncbi:MAG TPA: TetR/AcrR family transcriptional regulator [Fimbriimonadaceae bacterium]|nr:TetR/AcrR family transcriptional regulator [Fimbriimonadaceae bacterium]